MYRVAAAAGCLVGLALLSCRSNGGGMSARRQADEAVWRASVDNGDKPGIGIVLVQRGDEVTGTFYLLDPEKPDDFEAGRGRPMEAIRWKGREIQFAVDLGGGQRVREILRLVDPLVGGSARATLRAEDADWVTELTFHRER